MLEMARVAAPVQGIASFHGGLVPLTGDTAIPSTIGVQARAVFPPLAPQAGVLT